MLDFSAEFKKAMQDKKINVVELQKKTGLSHTYIYDLLKDERRWHEAVINKFCTALNVKLSIQ